MKGFFLRGLKFLGILLVVYFLTAPLLLMFQNPMMIKRSWYRVYTRVLRSQKKIKSNELYLGDSVAGQFFHASKKENYLTTNGSVLMAGHYILACNALENNPNIKSVILLSVPNAIGHEFERPRTYNYFVRPFYSRKHMEFMDEHIKIPMAEKPISKLTILDGFRILPTADVDFGTLLKVEKEPATLSDLSITYLKKLKQKCEEYGVDLYLISPPVRSSWRGKSEDFQALKTQVETEGLTEIFKGYFESIVYIDDDNFKDGIHIKASFLKNNKQDLIDTFMANSAYKPL